MNLSLNLQDNFVFKVVSEAGEKLGYDTYVVGGFVRDLLLKRQSKDIDFVCIGNGLDLARRVADSIKGKKSVSYYKNFGTASIKVKDYELEFVGARKESYRKDSRKPIVEDGSLEDDQKRRDFTINALAISLNSTNYGELIDPFDGTKDLKRKIVRTPLDPNITFSDDPLRMMRAVRFASQLSFDIDADTFEAISQNAKRLSIVSQERITDELNKIILSPQPSYGFKLLFHSGLLKEFFPELVDLQGVETVDGKSHKDNFYHTLEVLDNVASSSQDLWIRWAALLHDIAKPATKRYVKNQGWTFHGHEDRGARMVPRLFRRLRLPMDRKMDFVKKLVRLHLRPIPLVRDEITDSAVRRLLFEAGDDIDSLMALCRADITSKNHERVKRYLRNFDKVEKKLRDVEQKDHLRNFQPPITGEVIMNTFKIPPSKIIGEIKDEIKESILEGEIQNNYEEAFQLMMSIASKKGLKIAE
jgi:putative nucleotidyltransferase with HDIG domain